MTHVEVGPQIKQSTHHVSLTDGEKTLGLIICDSKGAADPFNISMDPNQRSALRTKSGTTKYEDLEEPWSATAQDDWSGGRALEDYETDTTRFFDSKRCQTAWQQIYNAPLEYYAKGLKDAISNYPGSVHWKMIESSNAYATHFSITTSIGIGQLYILLRRRGVPESGLTVSLCNDDNGVPGSVITQHVYTVDEITDVVSEFRKFTFSELSLAAGTYWIMAKADRGELSNCWQIGMKPVEESSTKVYKGRWGSFYGYDLYYRLSAADTGRMARFFTYKQLTFALTQLPTGEPKLYVNGEIGMYKPTEDAPEPEPEDPENPDDPESTPEPVTPAVEFDPYKIIDKAKSWTVDQWKGCRVGIINGTGIAETESVWRTVVSNDIDSLTVDAPWTIEQDESTVYIITDTDTFYEIPQETHGLTGYVTDIIIANDIIFFAQGDRIPIRKMKWANGNWMSIADEYQHYMMPPVDPDAEEEPDPEEDPRELVLIQNCAMYLQTVRDTNGLMLWRAQNDDDHHQISVSQSAITDWLPEQIVLADLNPEVDDGNGNMIREADSIIPRGESELFTAGVDFMKPDDVSVLYKITAGVITGDGATFSVAFQASEDNIIYEDVKTVQLETNQEELYAAFTTKRRWRRLHITITAGSSPVMESLKIETVPYDKFVTSMTFNDSYGKITGLNEYPQMMNTQYKTLWINREGMIHSISGENVVDTINLEELSTVMEEWNGKSSMVHNVYYYFRWMRGGIQRYYNQQVDAVGPDRDTGLPEERQGQISDMLAYPGRYFAAIDAVDGVSCVLLNNNSGWHEIYRAPNAGERIRAIGFQAISGTRPDRLWISVGDDIVWLVMPSNTLKAYYDKEAEYTHESVLVSSWMSIGMVDVIKQWGSMNIMAEHLEADNVYIEADYQIDQDPTWYPMNEHYVTSPDQEVKFKANFGVSAKRLRYRLRLQTNDKSKTPFVKAVVMKTVIKIGTKYSFGMSCRNVVNDVNLRGEVETISPWDRLETLLEWANNATALHMEAFTYPFDNKIVFVDPPHVSNLREMDRPGMLIQLTLNEI